MSKYERIDAPRNNYVPANPITIQGRINPKAFNIKNPIDADYRVPPRTLIFTHKDHDRATGFAHSRQSMHVTKQARREGSVCDVMCNFYETGTQDREIPRLRFLGVSDDGIADSRGARTHPDAVGRFSVIVSGAVSIMCDKEDLKNINVGDKIAFKQTTNHKVVSGLPKTFTTCSLKKAGIAQLGSISPTDADGKYREIDVFTTLSEYDAKTSADKVDKISVGLACEFASMHMRVRTTFQSIWATKGDTLAIPQSIINRDRALHSMTKPKDVAGRTAIFYLSLVGEEKAVTEWENMLYSPASPYWCGQRKPISDHDPAWLDHCYGYNQYLDFTVDDKAKTWDLSSGTPNCNAAGATLGWIARVFLPLLIVGTPAVPGDPKATPPVAPTPAQPLFKWGWKDRSIAEDTIDRDITAKDVTDCHAAKSGVVSEFLAPFMNMPGQHAFHRILYTAAKGAYQINTKQDPRRKAIAIYGETEADFKAKFLEVQKRLTDLGMQPHLIYPDGSDASVGVIYGDLAPTITKIEPLLPGATDTRDDDLAIENTFVLYKGESIDPAVDGNDRVTDKTTWLRLYRYLAERLNADAVRFPKNDAAATKYQAGLEYLYVCFAYYCCLFKNDVGMTFVDDATVWNTALQTKRGANTKPKAPAFEAAKKAVVDWTKEHQLPSGTEIPSYFYNVVGVLLEKYEDSNEARILLTPGEN